MFLCQNAYLVSWGLYSQQLVLPSRAKGSHNWTERLKKKEWGRRFPFLFGPEEIQQKFPCNYGSWNCSANITFLWKHIRPNNPHWVRTEEPYVGDISLMHTLVVAFSVIHLETAKECAPNCMALLLPATSLRWLWVEMGMNHLPGCQRWGGGKQVLLLGLYIAWWGEAEQHMPASECRSQP